MSKKEIDDASFDLIGFVMAIKLKASR